MTGGLVALAGSDWPQAELVAALQAGDPQAFEVLVRRYGGRLLAVVRRLLRNEEDAKDCVQEAFLQAFRRINQFEGQAEVGTWLHRIAVNQALMKLRSSAGKREASIDDLLPDFDQRGCRIEPVWDFRESVDEMLTRRQTCEQVLAKIAELPDNHRIVLMLRDIEELSTQDVAELLNLQEGTVKVRLHRARAALKKRLEPLWQGSV